MVDVNDAVCNIKVVCRFRPLNESEVKSGSKYVVKHPSNAEDCLNIGVSIEFELYPIFMHHYCMDQLPVHA